LSGLPSSRNNIGLPEDWNRIESWIRFKTDLTVCEDPTVSFVSKWPDIPVLSNYDSNASPDFWSKFPSKPWPSRPETNVDIDRLEAKVLLHKDKMTIHQLERSLKAVDHLRNGAPAHQSEILPGCFVKNSKTAFTYGKFVTEEIATWIEKGYAAGPFDSPPTDQFRVNPILAVVQPDKIRVILNVSAPEDESFNSNVNEFETETVKMASARIFGQKLMDCGKDSVMSKQDLKAAYKQVPAKLEDLRLQGFFWLGKFFVETRQIFGAKTSVCNFDILGETLKLLALLESIIPPSLVLRQVDDVPCVSPANTDWTADFTQTYKDLCSELNVMLAEDCPLLDKAFSNQVRGKVLGIMFDSTDLSWRLPDKKIEKCLKSIHAALSDSVCTLKNFQKLVGRLNDISQMCCFLKIYKQPISDCLGGVDSGADPSTPIFLSPHAEKDLLVWAGFLLSEHKWLPLASPYTEPPLKCKEFVSDAAGLAESADFGSRPGAGNIGFCENGTIIFANQLLWPEHFIKHAVDEKGVRFGDKSTTLETIAMLVPFVITPELFVKQHVILKADCFGTIFGMTNRYAKGDRCASIFIRSIYLISAYLSCTVHVQHLPRLSDWGAEVSDRLSRRATCTIQDRKLLRAFSNRTIPSCLQHWLHKPSVDWSLPTKLLDHVKSLV